MSNIRKSFRMDSEKMTVEIMRTTVSDRSEFYALEEKCFDMKYDDEDVKYYWSHILLHQYCLKAVIDGKIVGGIVSMPTYNKEWYLNALFVDPNYRRMSIARKLIKHMFDNMWLESVILDVRPDRPHLVKFYNSLGFEIIGHSTNHYKDGMDRFNMRKSCTPVRNIPLKINK